MRGPVVQDWASQGVLAPLDSIAADWAKVLPPAVDTLLKEDGHYYAVPHWMHRTNWLWINKAALDKVGGKPPTTWDEFFALADKLKAAGYVAIAHGETPYEDGYLFQAAALSMGADFFRKAILEHDQATLASPKMVQVFDIMRKMQGYFDNGTQGRAWNMSVAMLIENKAGMFFMGDWSKGEFSVANKIPDKDYICSPDPGTAGVFTFTLDTFVFFRQHGGPATKAQLDMAADIISPAYQKVAAAYKGAIPVNTTVPVDSSFDVCAQKSAADMKAATSSGTLMPSMNQGVDEARLGAMTDVIVKFMSSNQDSKSAAQAFAAASKNQ
jgi:glucose/mannose transport system substrate-binding protein